MLIKINRENCIKQFPSLPLRFYDSSKEEEEYYYPNVFTSYILTTSSKTFQGHIKTLGRSLITLLEELNCDSLIFLGDTKIVWLYQENDYRQAQLAQQYLVSNKIGKRFNGALKVGLTELPVFLKHLCWLTRCNAALPYFYFSDHGQSIIGNICKYGNLHLDTMNLKTDKLVKTVITQSQFINMKGNMCYNQFGKTSVIPGRKSVF